MLPAKPGAHAGAAPPHWRSSAGADWGARARRRQPLGQGWRRAHITGRSEALCGRDAGKRSALWLLGPQACQLQTAGQAQVGLRDCLRTQTLGWRTIRRGMTLTQGGAAPGIRITGAMTTLSGMDRSATPVLRMPRWRSPSGELPTLFFWNSSPRDTKAVSKPRNSGDLLSTNFCDNAALTFLPAPPTAPDTCCIKNRYKIIRSSDTLRESTN